MDKGNLILLVLLLAVVIVYGVFLVQALKVF
jgi:hypothetical protein